MLPAIFDASHFFMHTAVALSVTFVLVGGVSSGWMRRYSLLPTVLLVYVGIGDKQDSCGALCLKENVVSMRGTQTAAAPHGLTFRDLSCPGW